MIDIAILGSAAGGGSPQWNSNSPACVAARHGESRAMLRSQASIAMSADGEHWFILNASPDLRAQIIAEPALHPRPGSLRDTPIAGVLLTGGEVDTVTGLLTMRERQAFRLYATPSTFALLDQNPIFSVLDRDLVMRDVLRLNERIMLPLPDGRPSGLFAEAFAVPGKPPLYAEDAADPTASQNEDETIGLAIDDGTRTLLYVPGCATMTEDLRARSRHADAVFFDATLWRDDEMIAGGYGAKTGRRMGHMSVAGPGGVLDALKDCTAPVRMLIHINNSNPLLLTDSPERAQAEASGWRVAEDGMRISI
jgi:pyrroloquinoline quinone biosynthesis protein B